VTISVEQIKSMLPESGLLKLAVFQTGGEGPSSTKIVYLNVGLIAIYGWLLMVITFCAVYACSGEADGVFAGVIGSVLLAIVGFATNAQNTKNKATADASKVVSTSVRESTPPPPSGSTTKVTDIVSQPAGGTP
jgi:hypothetical protein